MMVTNMSCTFVHKWYYEYTNLTLTPKAINLSIHSMVNRMVKAVFR